MKKAIIAIAMGVVLGLVISTANADITTGLIAHYTFDDTLAGSAGGEVTGVKLGTGAAVYQSGAYGAVGQAVNNKAIRLDGIDDAILFNHSITSYTDGRRHHRIMGVVLWRACTQHRDILCRLHRCMEWWGNEPVAQ